MGHCISPFPAFLHWIPTNSRRKVKILYLAYNALQGLKPSYLKEILVPYYPNGALQSQTKGLLVVPAVSKSRLEAEPSVIRLLSCVTSSQSVLGNTDTLSTLTILLKCSFLIKLIISAGLGALNHPFNYAVLGPDCWETSHEFFPCSVLFTLACMSLLLLICLIGKYSLSNVR